MKWSEEVTVRPSDTDINGIASASAVLSYVQNAGYYQHFYVGPSLEDIRKNGMAFILSRAALRIYEPMYACDKLTAESWPCKISDASFMRSARIMRGDCTVAEAITSWALVDIESGKLCRADSVKLGFGTDEPGIARRADKIFHSEGYRASTARQQADYIQRRRQQRTYDEHSISEHAVRFSSVSKHA